MTVRMVPGMQTQNYSPAIQAPHQVQAVQPAQQIPAPGSSYLPPSNYFDNYQTNGYQQQQQALPPKMNSVPSQVATNSLYNQQPPMQQPVSLLPKSQPPVVLARVRVEKF